MNDVSVTVASTTSPCWGFRATNDAPTGLGVAGVKLAIFTNRGALYETSNNRIVWAICHRGSGGIEKSCRERPGKSVASATIS